MWFRSALPAFTFLFIAATYGCALESQPSIASDECGSDKVAGAFLKTTVFDNQSHDFRVYGEVLVRRETKAKHCLATYRIWIARETGSFSIAKKIDFTLDDSQIAGIDLIGLSPDGTEFAADFWWAEGDATIHHPVIIDRKAGQAADMALDDRIQKRIHGCDQVEDFVGVTNAGEAIFAVPSSIYDDSPGCGDKGLWRFNVKTGRVYRVAKNSGIKWR